MSDMVIWKTIPEWNGYEVSSHGDVRNAKTQKVLAKELHYGKDKKAPYHRVQVYKNGKSKHLRINRVVAHAFLGKPEHDKMEVDHLNNIRLDNHHKNLEWVTPQENKRRMHARKKQAT